MTHDTLTACTRCAQVLRLGPVPRGRIARCPRCHAALRRPRGLQRAAAFALAALILYPLAMALPIIEVERLGHRHATTIWQGVVALLAEREILIGLVILVCSVIAPLAKLAGIFAITAGHRAISARGRAKMHRAIDWIGKWGMIDVLLVAVLVAAVKLGNWAEVHPGPGALAFGSVVILSLLASASFSPAAIWESEP